MVSHSGKGEAAVAYIYSFQKEERKKETSKDNNKELVHAR